MRRLLGIGDSLGNGWNRRDVIRVGSLGLLAAGWNRAGLPGEVTRTNEPVTTARSFGRAKSCIFLFLMGGPPQHSTWDPKPDAPGEVRGDFGPIATTVPGMSISELLPHTASGRGQDLHLAGRFHGRQCSLVQWLLYAHRSAPPADELRECQSGCAERCAESGCFIRPDRSVSGRHARFDHAPASDLQHRWQRLAGPGCGIPGPISGPLAPECPVDARGIPHPGDRLARRPRSRSSREAKRSPRSDRARAGYHGSRLVGRDLSMSSHARRSISWAPPRAVGHSAWRKSPR